MPQTVLNPPFCLHNQLNADLDKAPQPGCSAGAAQSLPGYPYVRLHDRCAVLNFVEKEFCSDDLDAMAGRLWWMSKQDAFNISPLHRQLVKRRSIVVSEDPKLHLVWIHDRIFIKPLPKYILSYEFWQRFIIDQRTMTESQSRIYRAALGYLRTYTRLIRYESDFRIAQDPSLSLIPSSVSWEQFCNFAYDLTKVPDRDVSMRYTYGEIRLTRLNFYAPFIIRKSNFQRVDYQYATYFAKFYGPVLFVIGISSLILSGLQVVVAVKQELSETGSRSTYMAALGISATLIVGAIAISVYICLLATYKVAKEWNFALRDRLKRLENDDIKHKA